MQDLYHQQYDLGLVDTFCVGAWTFREGARRLHVASFMKKMRTLSQKTETMWVVVKIMVLLCGPLNTTCRMIPRTQKGTIILTTTHVHKPALHFKMPT